jgi:hypothetical protein
MRANQRHQVNPPRRVAVVMEEVPPVRNADEKRGWSTPRNSMRARGIRASGATPIRVKTSW